MLDIGAWDGFHSFKAERRGADHVLATDSYVWRCGNIAGFELVHKILRSKVKSKEIDVMNISPDTVGLFDVVLSLEYCTTSDILCWRLRRLLALPKDNLFWKPI